MTALAGEIRDVPFGETEPTPDDGTPMMLQKTYERECGCRILSGFRLDDETLTRIARRESLSAIGRDSYRIGLRACDAHDGLSEIWRAAYVDSLIEPQQDEALAVGARLLDRLLDKKETG